MKFYFLALKNLKKNIEDQDNSKMFLPVCFKHPILQIIVSSAKQKRDICTAFPASSLSSSSAAAAA